MKNCIEVSEGSTGTIEFQNELVRREEIEEKKAKKDFFGCNFPKLQTGKLK